MRTVNKNIEVDGSGTPIDVYGLKNIADAQINPATEDTLVTLFKAGQAVDTELPAAVAASDAMSNPTAPQVLSHGMGWDSTTSQWKRALSFNLINADTGGGTQLIPAVNCVQRASGGGREIGTLANPWVVRLNNYQTPGDSAAFQDVGSIWSVQYIYDVVSDRYVRARQAQASYSAAGLAVTGVPVNALYGIMDDASIDLAAEDKFHCVRITQYRALHNNLRDSSGNEIGTSTKPVYESILDPQVLKVNKIDPMRNIATVEPYRLVGTDFGGTTKDTNFWTEAIGGAGGTAATVVQAGQVTLSVGDTTSGHYALYTSVRKARYSAGSANFFRSVIRLPDAGYTNNCRRWGAFTNTTTTPNNGAWFELDGTTLYIAYVTNGGTPTTLASGSWNGTAFTLDTNAHTYEIWWTNSKIWFLIDDILRHTVTASTAVWSYMGAFNANLQNWNYGTAGGTATLECRVASIYRFGHLETSPHFFHGTTAATTVLKYGAGILHRVTLNDPRGTLITIYDDTSGTSNTIAVINTPATANPAPLEYHIAFNNGLKFVTTGTWDYTVVYE